ncbi:tyrosine-type recombinase/integrase [Epilithonimonas sp. UC225_85]|uniref:tyrosine-type recombinase/integrase n=1 Tax=Epilithonimonas sp. UC225_85 TaxID=3350167 RepID=UPI0036D31F64
MSSHYINSQLVSLEKFFEFLRHKGVKNLPEINLRRLEIEKMKREILSVEEIKELYKIIDEQECITPKQEALNYQDKVILAVYYGCGLRNSEGRALCLDDINLDTQILIVKKGKGNKQRLIPFNNTVKDCLKLWMYEYRMILLKDKTESRLFISSLGRPVCGSTLGNRLKRIILQSESVKLKEKHIALHSLRHSIATHLLAGGMDIQKVQKFLGHSCLDSTEIYTHLIEEA